MSGSAMYRFKVRNLIPVAFDRVMYVKPRSRIRILIISVLFTSAHLLFYLLDLEENVCKFA